MRQSTTVTSFNAGELSDKIDIRSDLAKYRTGCKRLQNALVTPYGGIRKRGGTEFIAASITDDKLARPIPWEISGASSFVLIVGENTIRLYRDGIRARDGDNNPITLLSPWQAEDLRAIKFRQVNDVMWLVHPDYPVQKITRLSDTSWTLVAETFDPPAFRDQNETATTITPSAVTGTGITLVASTSIFTNEDIGSSYQITHDRDSGDYERVVSLSGSSTPTASILIQGEWAIVTSGTWSGTLKLQRRAVGAATWVDYRSYSAANNRNVSSGNTEPDLMEYRLTYSGTGSGSATLEARSGIITGTVRITAVASGTNATADVTAPLYSTDSTSKWAEAAWSAKSGYPAAIAFHEQRMVLAGTYAEPNRVWASAFDDYPNFNKGTAKATDASTSDIVGEEINAIHWLFSDRRLIAGSSTSEYAAVEGDDRAGVLEPGNTKWRRQSAIGSASIQPQLANSSIIFVQDKGRKMFDYNYTFERDRYVEDDVTLLSDHITRGGILDMAIMKRRDLIVWCVTGMGKLIGFTYMKDQQVAGWHPHDLGDGFVESLCVIQGSGEEDEIWLTVRRTINNQTKRYIERIKPDTYNDQEDETQSDWFYVDCGKTLVANPAKITAITGATHLEGKTVAVLADGKKLNPVTITAGQAALPGSYDKVTYGLPMKLVVAPMTLESPQRDGSSRGRISRIIDVRLNLWKSFGGQVTDREGNTPRKVGYKIGQMDAAPAPFTGEKEVFPDSAYDEMPQVVVEHDDPYPFALLGLIVKWETND